MQLGEHKKVDDGAEYVVKVDKGFFFKMIKEIFLKSNTIKFKVEPHDNGPLFVEVHALLAVGRQKSLSSWNPRCHYVPDFADL